MRKCWKFKTKNSRRKLVREIRRDMKVILVLLLKYYLELSTGRI